MSTHDLSSKKPKLFQIKLFVVILFWLVTFMVLASCTCAKLPTILSQIEYDGTDAIIKGKVVYTKIDEEKGTSFTVFKIQENYKPDAVKESVIKLECSIDPESCGLQFNVNENWLLFAYKKDSVYTTSSCTRTMLFIPQEDYHLYIDRYIDGYHKNLKFLKSKQD